MKSSLFTDRNDEEDDVNIFMTSSKLSTNLISNNPVISKGGSLSSNKCLNKNGSQGNLNNEKVNEARRILDEAGQKMKEKPMSYGLTSNISLLNMNASLGKSSMLGQAIKFDSSVIANGIIDNSSNVKEGRKNQINSINPKYAENKSIKIEEIREVDCELTDKSFGIKILAKPLETSEVNTAFPSNKLSNEVQAAQSKKEESVCVTITNNSQQIIQNDPRVLLYDSIMSTDQINNSMIKTFLYT